jgi:nitroreductase
MRVWAPSRTLCRLWGNQTEKKIFDPMNRNSSATSADIAVSVEEAITTRKSIRRFLPTPVPPETVERILAVARRAPSGTNMQPWRVYVLTGAGKERISAAIIAADRDRPDEHSPEFRYYPPEFPEPYKSRRRKIGWDLYGLLGIEKGDKEKMHAQHARNYIFFDAPVGMIFTIDRVLKIGSWLDYGMFMQNVMVAARGLGLHTCPQVSFAKYHAVLEEHLGLAETEMVVCGMSLGYADHAAPENGLVTEREPVHNFARFIDT